MSLREDIRAYATATFAPVLMVPTPELPQWDGAIGVARCSPRALANHWQDSDEDEQLDERARFVALAACDAEGNRIFQDGDMLWLSTSALLSPMVERLYWAAREHNGLTEANRKNFRPASAATGGGGSHSSCAGPSTPATAST